MHNLWNKIGMFEIEEQHFACQFCSIFKNKGLTEIEIQKLWRQIEKDEIAQKMAERTWLNMENMAVIQTIILGAQQKIMLRILSISV